VKVILLEKFIYYLSNLIFTLINVNIRFYIYATGLNSQSARCYLNFIEVPLLCVNSDKPVTSHIH
jgi:hypothetical protein